MHGCFFIYNTLHPNRIYQVTVYMYMCISFSNTLWDIYRTACVKSQTLIKSTSLLSPKPFPMYTILYILYMLCDISKYAVCRRCRRKVDPSSYIYIVDVASCNQLEVNAIWGSIYASLHIDLEEYMHKIRLYKSPVFFFACEVLCHKVLGRL